MTVGLMRGTIHRCTKFNQEMYITRGLIKVRFGGAGSAGRRPGRDARTQRASRLRAPPFARVLCPKLTWRLGRNWTDPWSGCTRGTWAPSSRRPRASPRYAPLVPLGNTQPREEPVTRVVSPSTTSQMSPLDPCPPHPPHSLVIRLLSQPRPVAGYFSSGPGVPPTHPPTHPIRGPPFLPLAPFTRTSGPDVPALLLPPPSSPLPLPFFWLLLGGPPTRPARSPGH